jgi:hypothetical protein
VAYREPAGTCGRTGSSDHDTVYSGAGATSGRNASVLSAGAHGSADGGDAGILPAHRD